MRNKERVVMTLRGYETTSIGIVGWGGILRLDLGKERKG